MKAVVQRVSAASVVVDAASIASIGTGLVVLVGLSATDTFNEGKYLIDKLLQLRIFPDDGGKMNRSLQDVQGELLLISQFTLCADTQRGTRPSFAQAMPAESARKLFEDIVAYAQSQYHRVQTGQFQADMKVSLCNDGPVTIVLEK